MTNFKQSETRINLMRAFAGESQARNRYTFAAAQAKTQKLHLVEAIFTFTANQEKEHAEIFYNHMKACAGQTRQSERSWMNWAFRMSIRSMLFSPGTNRSTLTD